MIESQPKQERKPITAGQRAALFAAGRARGLTIDGLRAMTPAGSISLLTFDEAAALLTRLNAETDYAQPRKPDRGPRRPKGIYAIRTPAQLGKVESLRIELGWTVDRLLEFLRGRTFTDGHAMDKWASTDDGRHVIELLKAVLKRQRAAQSRAATQADANAGAALGTTSGSDADAWPFGEACSDSKRAAVMDAEAVRGVERDSSGVRPGLKPGSNVA